MLSLYRGPKGTFYAHLLSNFALKPPQYLYRRWQKYGEESLQRENNFIRSSSYIDIYYVCLTLFFSSSRKLTSWLCFLSDLYPDLDSWRCPGKHWTWQSSQGHTANLATTSVQGSWAQTSAAHSPHTTGNNKVSLDRTQESISSFLTFHSQAKYIHILNILLTGFTLYTALGY